MVSFDTSNLPNWHEKWLLLLEIGVSIDGNEIGESRK